MKEQKLDECYRRLNDIASTFKIEQGKIDNLSKSIKRDDNAIGTDFLLLNVMNKELKRNLENKIKDFLNFIEEGKIILINIIVNGCIENVEITYLLYEQLSKSYQNWKIEIEQLVVLEFEAFEQKRTNKEEFIEKLLTLTEFLPNRYYESQSIFLQIMKENVANKNTSILYYTMLILWEQQYTDKATLQWLKKHLQSNDWRVRVLAYEYLTTWSKRGVIEKITIPKLTFGDKLRKTFFRNFKSKMGT